MNEMNVEDQVGALQLKLFVEASQGQVDSTTPVRWCLTPAAAGFLRNEGVAASWVLLSIVKTDEGDGYREVERKLIPLEQMMTYVQFPKPGRYRIFGAVVYTTRPDGEFHNKIRGIALDRKCDYASEELYKFRVLDYDSGAINFQPSRILSWIADPNNIGAIGRYSLEVVVPAELFAKEPPRWLKWWVTLLWDAPMRDQCDFKKRMIFAFTAQPFILAIAGVCYAVGAVIASGVKLCWALAALSLGMRTCPGYGIDWSPILTPFNGRPYHVWDSDFHPAPEYKRGNLRRSGEKNLGGSFVLYDKNGVRRPFCYIIFTPLIWIGVLAAVATWFRWQGDTLLRALLTAAGITVAVLVVVGAITLFLYYAVWFPIAKRLPGLEEQEREKKEQQLREIAAYQERLRGSMAVLVCEATPPKARLDALPPERRTIYLRFLDLKARICRPYAQ